MRSTAACSASPTRSSCSRRGTSRCPRRSARACSSAASSTRREVTAAAGPRSGVVQPLHSKGQPLLRGFSPSSYPFPRRRLTRLRATWLPPSKLGSASDRTQRSTAVGDENGYVWPTATTITVLADWVDSVETFIQVFVAVYILLIFGFILTSWIGLPYSPWLTRIKRSLSDVCEPYLRLFRRILPTVGPLDLSPIVAIIALYVAQQILFTLLDALR